MRRWIARTMLVWGLGCMACTPQPIVPEPGQITLQEAMKAVGEGLRDMKQAEGNVRTGLAPSEVTVVFNVSASSTEKGKLLVEVGSPLPAGVAAKVGGETGAETVAARGNQITVKFENVLFAPPGTLVHQKDPKDIGALLAALESAGITVYMRWPGTPQTP